MKYSNGAVNNLSKLDSGFPCIKADFVPLQRPLSKKIPALGHITQVYIIGRNKRKQTKLDSLSFKSFYK